jgi:chromodomain-helicase-DNA-binding protein 4
MVDDSEDGEEWDEDTTEEISSVSSSIDSSVRPRGTRRSTRQTTVQTRLPFSPKKSTRAFGQHGDDSDFDASDSPTGSRKATRHSTRSTRLNKRVVLDDEYEAISSDHDSDEDYSVRGSKSTGVKKPARVKKSHPAYGHFRSIAELDWDPVGDASTAALRAHRDRCEKCSRPPTHILLSSKRKGRKRKDEDEFSERIESLGGWVRW